MKLKSFAKLSGGKGIHVVVPIDGADWDTAKNFSAKNRTRHGRRQPAALSRQNDQGAAQGQNLHRLSAQHARGDIGRALFDARAPRRAVSAPLSWEELGRTKSAADFTVLNLKKHFRNDPWADIGKVRQKLPAK